MWKLALIIISLMIVSAGCIDVKEPEVVGTASIKHLEIEYGIDLTISNPNDIAFKVSDIEVTLRRTNGEVIGSGIIKGDEIPEKSSKKLVGILKIGDTLLKAQEDEKIVIVIDGTAKGGILLFQKTFPIHKEREIINPLKGKTQLNIEL